MQGGMHELSPPPPRLVPRADLRAERERGWPLGCSWGTVHPRLRAAPKGPEDVALAEPIGFESFFEANHSRFGALCLVTGNRREARRSPGAFLKLWERWDWVSALEDPTGFLFRTAMKMFHNRALRAAVAARKALGLANRGTTSRRGGTGSATARSTRDAPSVPQRNRLLAALGRAATGSPGSCLPRRRDLRGPGRPRPCQHLRSAGSRRRRWRPSAAAALTRNSAWLCTRFTFRSTTSSTLAVFGEGAEWIGRTDSASAGEIGAAVRSNRTTTNPARRNRDHETDDHRAGLR